MNTAGYHTLLRHIVLLGLLTLSTSLLHAQWTVGSVPNPHLTDRTNYVANPSGILTQAEAEQINLLSRSLYDQMGVEMVVVALDDIGYSDAFDFSLELFNTWGIGSRETNTGLLILLAVETRDIQIRTGGGLEGVLPDAVCHRIQEEVMVPILSEDRYGEGLVAGAEAFSKRLMSDSAREELLLGYHRREVTTLPWSFLATLCLFLIVMIVLVRCSKPRCPHCHERMTTRHDEVTKAATALATGLGVHHYTCRCCHHTWDKIFTIPTILTGRTYRGGGGFGGGFGGGGFGGGSFGGGMSFGGGSGGKF